MAKICESPLLEGAEIPNLSYDGNMHFSVLMFDDAERKRMCFQLKPVKNLSFVKERRKKRRGTLKSYLDDGCCGQPAKPERELNQLFTDYVHALKKRKNSYFNIVGSFWQINLLDSSS